MQWEHLSNPEFSKAVKDTKLCILPMGVLERHGDHMPVGTDCMETYYVACEAAKVEPAVVFPLFYYGQANESRAFPGNISINPVFTFQLLEQVLDEIARNGFEKIMIYNLHGGNYHMIRFLAQTRLWEKKPYSLYVYELDQETIDEITAVFGSAPSHADEWETSVIMGIHPQDIHTEQLPDEPANPLGRLAHLKNIYTSIWWYADFPENYTNDAHAATAEKGKKILAAHIRSLVKAIRAVKQDTMVRALEKEFHKRADDVCNFDL